jgi:hypothetical protein
MVMRRRLTATGLVAIASLLAVGATRGEVVQVKNLRISFQGSFTPHALPRDRPVPIKVTIKGGIATTDGSHPPALRRLEIGLNRQGRLSTVGLPTCSGSALQSTTTAAALALCRPALVGRGHFSASLAFTPGSLPSHGTILAFNSRVGRKPALLLHLYGTVPVRATLVAPLTIERRGRGDFGTVFSARIPKIGGGLGSITSIELTVGREYRYGGKRRGFISASCPAPAGFPGAPFPFARGSFYFAHGEKVVTTLTRNCQVRG